MKEKEKMILGLDYDAGDKELVRDREKAKDLCFSYNYTMPSKKREKIDIMKALIGKIKGDFTIEPNFFCDYGYNIELGENFYSNHNIVILDCAKVTFGKNVFIAPNCGFYTAGHPIDREKRASGEEYAYPIKVGNDVWIGGNVIVLPGVSIGDNVVIGAGSVVNRDIPSNSVAVGNPCKVIKKL